MIMSEADGLFKQAYGLHVVDERTGEAIELCRQALEIEPDHYRARVFLGMLLDDHGNEEEKFESRQHFVEAIERAKNLTELCDSEYEQSALYRLGVWERYREHNQNAGLCFLTHALLCKSDASYRQLVELLDELTLNVAEKIKALVRHASHTDGSIPKDDVS
jgi:tetratricopeptide (TPR) repeat protein